MEAVNLWDQLEYLDLCQDTYSNGCGFNQQMIHEQKLECIMIFCFVFRREKAAKDGW